MAKGLLPPPEFLWEVPPYPRIEAKKEEKREEKWGGGKVGKIVTYLPNFFLPFYNLKGSRDSREEGEAKK